jgi:hypothetical protein
MRLSTVAEEKCLKCCCGASLRTDKSLGGERECARKRKTGRKKSGKKRKSGKRKNGKLLSLQFQTVLLFL